MDLYTSAGPLEFAPTGGTVVVAVPVTVISDSDAVADAADDDVVEVAEPVGEN